MAVFLFLHALWLDWLDFLMIPLLTGMRWYLSISICISLIVFFVLHSFFLLRNVKVCPHFLIVLFLLYNSGRTVSVHTPLPPTPTSSRETPPPVSWAVTLRLPTACVARELLVSVLLSRFIQPPLLSLVSTSVCSTSASLFPPRKQFHQKLSNTQFLTVFPFLKDC